MTTTPTNPFLLLGLPVRYSVDRSAVESAYLARAAALHPDLAGDDPAIEAESAALNEAKRVLLDPELRAVAVYRLLGGQTGGAEERALPPGFLMEMMEVREQIEAAQHSGQAAELERWRRWGREKRREHERAVARLFEHVDPASASPAALRAIKLELNAWRYVERMLEQV